MTTRPQPPGLQNERTALAWQRTALSLGVGAMALTRFAYPHIGAPGLICLLAVPLTAAVLLQSSKRYRHRGGSGVRILAGDGLAGLALVLAVLVMCLTGLAIVLRW